MKESESKEDGKRLCLVSPRLSLGAGTARLSGRRVELPAAGGPQQEKALRRAGLPCLEAEASGVSAMGNGNRVWSMELTASPSGRIPKQAAGVPRQGHVISNGKSHPLRNSF